MQFCRKALHVFNPYLHAHILSCALVELRDSTRDCYITQYEIVAISTLFSSPFGPVWVDLLSKLNLDLVDDLDLDKKGHF